MRLLPSVGSNNRGLVGKAGSSGCRSTWNPRRSSANPRNVLTARLLPAGTDLGRRPGRRCLTRRTPTFSAFILRMKKTFKETQIVTGVAWYRPEQWERLREVSEDVENLDETYDAWLLTAE